MTSAQLACPAPGCYLARVLRFRLGPIPIEVHFSYALIIGLFALSDAQSDDFFAAAAKATPGTTGASTLVWAGILTLAILVHELGHAIFCRIFGYSPHIQLVGLFNYTFPNAPEEIPWWKNVVLTAAGPGAGLGLAFMGLGAAAVLEPGLPAKLAREVSILNLFLSVLNLLPISSLDGGQIATQLLMRVFGRRGFLFAQIISLAIVAVIIPLALWSQQIILLLLIVLLSLRSIALLRAYLRGDAPVGSLAHPLVRTVEEAERQYQAGLLAQAAATAQSIVDGPAPPPLVRSRAHHVLGWVALKSGKGREAMDHFSQVQGVPVAPHALAAAFSLIGDEARALPLWEEAAKTYDDPVIRHELAGSLIRLGREHELRRVPDIRPALAYAAAQRVHFLRGEYDKAAQASEAAFREEPSSRAAYEAACGWARAGDAAGAMRMLILAAQNGYRDATAAEHDEDLQSLREVPEFRDWLASLQKSPA